ncbi:phage protease [Campylobacter sp. RM9328]|uniref:phage protease n=1 Tax=Campylobacter sp. RM9328 TaxID=1705720 RepID=UPI0014727E44|nr:phage protease [Campylobacter sp. RM9328]
MNGVKSKELLELNFKDNEFVKVSPIGTVIGIDGRGFKIDGNSLLASIAKNALHIPLDENHSFGGAVGWFDKDSFELRDDGIYAKLELNQRGTELIQNRVYRYLSPVYDVNGKNVTALDSVGLVNRPNLLNNTLNHKGDNVEKELEELKAKNEALQKELDELKAANAAKDESKGETKSESTEEQANTKALNSIQSDLKNMNERMEKMESALKVFGKSDLQKSENAAELTDEQKKTAKLLGLSEEEYKKGL